MHISPIKYLTERLGSGPKLLDECHAACEWQRTHISLLIVLCFIHNAILLPTVGDLRLNASDFSLCNATQKSSDFHFVLSIAYI